MQDIYYFGCWDRPGHYLHNHMGYQVYDSHLPEDFPVRVAGLDGFMLPPTQPQVEGRAVILHFPGNRSGWTILTFWDRSVDKRSGCCSAFVCRGSQPFEEMVAICRKAFPKIWARYTFEVIDSSAP